MKFLYNEVTEKSLDINFDKLYEIISKETIDVYDEFCDNIYEYLKELCQVEIDFEFNQYFYEQLLDAWEEYLDKRNDYRNIW
jgi:hypothetical protein